MFKALYNFFSPAPKQPETKITFHMAIESSKQLSNAAKELSQAAKELTDKL